MLTDVRSREKSKCQPYWENLFGDEGNQELDFGQVICTCGTRMEMPSQCSDVSMEVRRERSYQEIQILEPSAFRSSKAVQRDETA